MSAPRSALDVRRRAARWRRQAHIVLIGAALFVALTIAAMVAFPGGADYDRGARRYLFRGNYLSDLGATHTYSGRANTTSRLLFTVALCSVGASLAVLGLSWKAWATRQRCPVAGAAATVSAALSGGLLIAAALTPWDRDYATHVGMIREAFGLILLFVACLVIVQIRNQAPPTWVAANIIYLVALSSYILVALQGPDYRSRGGLQFQITAQKAIVCATLLNLSLQAWGIRAQAGLLRVHRGIPAGSHRP